jgi:hypothetical protein
MHAAAIEKQTFVIHIENSSIHKSKAAIEKIASMRVIIVPHPTDSPDLASSNFFFWIYRAKDRQLRISVCR